MRDAPSRNTAIKKSLLLVRYEVIWKNMHLDEFQYMD